MKAFWVMSLGFALGCSSAWCQNDAKTIDGGHATVASSESPIDLSAISSSTLDLSSPVTMVSRQGQTALSQLFNSWQPNGRAPISAYGCPANQNSCGDACCGKDEQCCTGRGSPYCSKKC
jgi:hypothetical protein